MALFKRNNLKEKGLTDEQIEYIMTESGRALGDYELKSNIQAQIDAAVEAVKVNPEPVNVLETDEYRELLAKCSIGEIRKALRTNLLHSFWIRRISVVGEPRLVVCCLFGKSKFNRAVSTRPHLCGLSTMGQDFPGSPVV